LFTTPAKSQKLNTIPLDSIACSGYFKHREWLPDAYIRNAVCACQYLPPDSSAVKARNSLMQSLDDTPDTLVLVAKTMKSQVKNGEISKRKYKKFIKKTIAPKIYEDHKKAYLAAGCKNTPAPLWEWKIACTKPFKDCGKMLRYNFRFGGSCSGKNGNW
jgi:hypothetical protein